jgi:hypothetical protein
LRPSLRADRHRIAASAPRSAAAFAGDLKAEQALDAMSNPVIVRLDDSSSSDSIGEFDETLLRDRTHQVSIHVASNKNRV